VHIAAYRQSHAALVVACHPAASTMHAAERCTPVVRWAVNLPLMKIVLMRQGRCALPLSVPGDSSRG